MSKFIKVYKVRGTEIAPDYTMRRIYAACYFQECFAEMCSSKNMAAYDLQKLGLTWIISDMRIDFVSGDMPFWRDELEVSIWAVSKTPLFLRVAFSIKCKGKEFAKGLTNWLVAEDKTHKPRRLSPFGDEFDIVDEAIFEDENFSKFNELCDGKVGEIHRQIPSSEVDFNGHLANVQYAPTAFEAVPIDYRMEHDLKSYRIRFMREALYGDTILSETFGQDNKFFHKITRGQDNAVLCNIESVWEASAPR